MKFFPCLPLCLALVSCAIAAPATRTFENPILAGFYPDPSICRVGDDYYLVTSSFEYFPGVPIFQSKDLVHWRQIGHCLTRPSQLPLEKMRASGGIFAPTLRHREGKFYMVTTNVWGTSNFYVTANDPTGPWSEPVPLDKAGIDPSLFFDDDGTAYYTRHVGMADGYIGQTKLDVKTGRLEGDLKNIWRGTGGAWPEGPHLYKVDGRYYLMISEGGTSYDHRVTIARSNSPSGPFESCPTNPILTHAKHPDLSIQATGHADLVQTPTGWWAVCLGIRPQGGQLHHLGRETLLAPVSWSSDGWPTIGTGGTVATRLPSPELPPHAWPAKPTRDDFNAPALEFDWNFLRNPRVRDWSLLEHPGHLRLHGSAVTMNDQDSPAFVGRRQTFLTGHVATQLSFNPQRENEEAGMVIRGNDQNHFEVGLTYRDGARKAFFRRTLGGKVVGDVNYTDIPPDDVVLSINVQPLEYRFTIKTTTGPSVELGTARPQDLASEKIGGFTGVYFGLYATGNGQPASIPADFDWFEQRNDDH